jgi:hypothetical protein
MSRYDIATGNVPEPETKPPGSRDISVVINEMKRLIPESVANDEFVLQLDWIAKDSLYKAPEQQCICWSMLQHLVIHFIPRPFEEWHYQFFSVYSTQTVEKIKAYWNEHPSEIVVIKNDEVRLAKQEIGELIADSDKALHLRNLNGSNQLQDPR